MREQLVEFQKKEMIMTALNDDIPLALLSAQDHARLQSTQPSAVGIANIHVGLNQNAASSNNNSFRSGARGGEAVSHSDVQSTNISSAGGAGAPDEQGIRAFLHKLLNSRHLFSTSDIVD